VDDNLRKSLLAEARDLHSELTQSGLAPSVLGDSLLDRLERRFQGDSRGLVDAATKFINLAASCCKLQPGQLQPSDLLEKQITPMPKRLFLLGIPRHAFAAQLRTAFEKAKPSGKGYEAELYEHDEPAQIRLFIADYWMAARFASVVHGLETQYTNIGKGEAGEAVKYFANIDPDGEAGKRPALFLDPDRMLAEFRAKLWIGAHLQPPTIIEDSNGLSLISYSEEGSTPDRLGPSLADLLSKPSIPVMHKVSRAIGEALGRLSEKARADLQVAVSDEEEILKTKVKVTSPEFAAWSGTRKHINLILSPQPTLPI
jgi:hypothetical protein